MPLWKKPGEDTRRAAMWIEMVWMKGEAECRRILTLTVRSTLTDALGMAGLQDFAERWLAAGGGIAVEGRQISFDTVLRPMDRVEFLKSLTIRPGDLRLKRLGRRAKPVSQ